MIMRWPHSTHFIDKPWGNFCKLVILYHLFSIKYWRIARVVSVQKPSVRAKFLKLDSSFWTINQKLRRPFGQNKNHAGMKILRRKNDSGFTSFSRPGPVITIVDEGFKHVAEKSWDLNSRFNSEESHCDCGTQTTEESKTERLTR